MGEAKRRAERRREAAATGKPAPQYGPQAPMLETVTIRLSKVVMDEIRRELGHRQKVYTRLDQAGYIEAMVESAVERERQQREAQEAERAVIVPATTAQIQKVLARPAAVGMRTPR